MNDGDITEQLRIAAPLARAHMDSSDLVGWPIRFILDEAAAEIDRLRQQLANRNGETVTNPQFEAARQVIDAIVGPGKTAAGDLHASQRRLLEECGWKLGETEAALDEMRIRYEVLMTSHVTGHQIMKRAHDFLLAINRQLMDLGFTPKPGIGDLLVDMADFLE